MINEQITKILHKGRCLDFKENDKNEYYLQKYQGSIYIIVVEKEPVDEIKFCLAQDNFILSRDKIIRIFNEIE